jgi:hypothetical protein
LRTLCAPSPSHCATVHTTHSPGEGSMWFPHRMCRRKCSHTLSLNRNGESHLLSQSAKKRLNLVNTGNLPPAPAAPGGGAPEGRARAREFRNSQEGFGSLWGLKQARSGAPGMSAGHRVPLACMPLCCSSWAVPSPHLPEEVIGGPCSPQSEDLAL